MERLCGAKRIVEHRQKRMLEDRGALPREDRDLLREYRAMHDVLLNTPRCDGGGRGLEMADAMRYINDTDHLWTGRERTEFRRQEENDAQYPENERELMRCEAASANSKESYTARTVIYAARPCAGNTKGGNSNGC